MNSIGNTQTSLKQKDFPRLDKIYRQRYLDDRNYARKETRKPRITEHPRISLKLSQLATKSFEEQLNSIFGSSNWVSYCINLERRPDRWASALEEFNRVGLRTIKKWRAVDGQTADFDQISNTLFNKSWERYKTVFDYREISGGRPYSTAGCAFSHFEIWNDFLRNSHAQYAIIFEDDIKFSPEFLPRFADMMSYENPKNSWEIMYLGWELRGKNPVATSSYQDSINISGKIIYRTHAYIATRTAIKELIEFCYPPLEPVDWYMSWVAEDIATRGALPQIVLTEEDLGSDIREIPHKAK